MEWLIVNKHEIGAVAGFLTTICWLPQLWQVIRTKQTEAISLKMYILFNVGAVFSLCYGYLLPSTPLLVSSAITLSFSLMILLLKVCCEKVSR